MVSLRADFRSVKRGPVDQFWIGLVMVRPMSSLEIAHIPVWERVTERALAGLVSITVKHTQGWQLEGDRPGVLARLLPL